jgi:plasmid maintenance system killer protein
MRRHMGLPAGERMDLFISDKKLRRAIEDDALRGRYGTEMAKKITLRLAALRAAESLADFWPPKSGPERCHELKGDLAGTFSVDLKQPYRLLFKPIEPAPPLDRSDEQQRWRSVTSIDILAIEDTHE